MKPVFLTRLCTAAFWCISTPTSSFPVVLTSIQREFNLSDEEMGRVGSVLFCGTILATIVGSFFGTRVGPKIFILVGLAFTAIGFVLQCTAQSTAMLLAAFVCKGAGLGMVDLMLSPTVAALNPTTVTKSMSTAHAFFCFGGVGTSTLCTVLLSLDVHWRIIILVQLALPVVLGILFATQTFPELVNENAASEDSFTLLFKDPLFVWSFIVIFFAGAIELGASTWAPALLESYSHSPTLGGLSLMGFMFFMGSGRILIGRYGDRLSHSALIAGLGTVTIVGVFFSTIIPQPVVALFFVMVLGLGVSGLWPTALSVSSEAHPNGATKMFGALALQGNLGAVLMPWAIGAVSEATTQLRFGYALIGLAGICVVLLAGYHGVSLGEGRTKGVAGNHKIRIEDDPEDHEELR